MTTESVNSSELAAALEALRRELARLGERVAALEGAAGPVLRRRRGPPARPPLLRRAARALTRMAEPRARSEDGPTGTGHATFTSGLLRGASRPIVRMYRFDTSW